MGRLKALSPSILPILAPSRVVQMPRDQIRKEWEWRRAYGSAEWKKLRWEVLVRDLFQCQIKTCRKVEVDTSQLVADHIVPHRGDAKLFWDKNNLQTLCKACHDTVKQHEEKSAAQY